MPHLTIFATLAVALILFSIIGWVALNAVDDNFTARRISVQRWRAQRNIIGLSLALIGALILLAGALAGSYLAA